MSNFIQSTTDLRKGEDAIGTVFNKPAETFFNSMLLSNELLHYGYAITKRPALKLIAFWGYEKDYVNVQNNDLTFLENFKPLIPIPTNVLTNDLSNDLLISSSQERLRVSQGEFIQTINLLPNGIDKIELDGDYIRVFPTGSASGINLDNIQYNIYFGGQFIDAIIGVNSLSTNNYLVFRSIIRTDFSYLTPEYSIVKNFNAGSIKIAKNSDSLFFGDRIIFSTENNAYGILPNTETVVTENDIFKGKSITTLGNLIVTIRQEQATGVVEFQKYILITVITPQRQNANGNVTFTNTPIELSPRYGIIPYWIRRSFSDRGLLLASDTGLYLINLSADAKTLESIVSITNYRVADIFPVEYREFLFYVTASKRGLDYIRYEKFYLNAVSDSLQSLEHLLNIDDEIVKIQILIWHDAPIILILTKLGDVICVNLYLNQSGGMTALYSKWFTDYKVFDLVVSQGGVGGQYPLKENPEELLYILFAKKKEKSSAIFSAMLTITDLPDFREQKETRKPCVDLYSFISTEKMFFQKIDNNKIVDVRKPSLRFVLDNNNVWNVYILDVPIFKQRMVGMIIQSEKIRFQITEVIDEYNAKGFLLNRNKDFVLLKEFVIDDYKIKLKTLFGFSYLHYLSNEMKVMEGKVCTLPTIILDQHLYSGDRIIGMTTNYETILFNRVPTSDVALIEYSSEADEAYVGFSYALFWITTPLVTDRWFISTKSHIMVSMEFIGWKKSSLFSSILGHNHNTVVFANSAKDSDYAEDVDQFVRHFEFLLEHYNTTRMSVCFFSEDMIPVYLTAFGTICREHTE